MAFLESCRAPVEGLRVAPKALNHLPKLLLKNFLSNVGLYAFIFVVVAMVIGIFPLLQLGDQNAPAVTTLNEVGKSETVLFPLRLCSSTVLANFLDAIPQFPGDQWSVNASMNLPGEEEVPVVNRVFE